MAKIQVLLLSGAMGDGEAGRSDREQRDIEEALKLIDRKTNQITLEREPAVKFDEVQRIINDADFSVLQFSGHGTNDHSLVFESNDSKDVTLRGDLFAGYLAEEAGVACVLLNACFTRPIAELIAQRGIDAIGYEDALDEDISILFSKAFYENLAMKGDYKSAFKAACGLVDTKDTHAAKAYRFVSALPSGDGGNSAKTDRDQIAVDHLDLDYCAEDVAERRKERHAWLSEKLANLDEDIWREIASKHATNIQVADRQRAEKLATWLMEQEPSDAYRFVNRVYGSFNKRNTQDSDRMAGEVSGLMRVLAPTHLTEEEDLWVGWINSKHAEGKFSVTPLAGSALKAEILSAAADRRDVDTRNKRAPAELPAGTHRIDFPAVEGHDPGGQKQRDAIIRALQRGMGLDMASFQAQVQRQVQNQLYPEDQSGDIPLDELRVALESYQESTASFYMTIPLDLNQSDLTKLYELIGSLMEELPQIRVIALHGERTSHDRKNLMPFAQTLRELPNDT